MLVLNSADLCTVRVYMATTNDFIMWANTHEYSVTNEMTYREQSEACETIANAYAEILLPEFKVKKIVLSTFVPDGEPYNPNSFVVFDYNLQGRRGRNDGAAVDLNVCLTMLRRTGSGRNGRFLLRGVLTEAMVKTVNGVSQFELPIGLDSIDFLDAERRIMNLKTVGNLSMVMAPRTAVNANSQYVRTVDTIIRGGLTFKRLRNN